MIEVPDVDMDASAPADAAVDSSDDEEMSLDALKAAALSAPPAAVPRAPALALLGLSDKELRFVLDRTPLAALHAAGCTCKRLQRLVNVVIEANGEALAAAITDAEAYAFLRPLIMEGELDDLSSKKLRKAMEQATGVGIRGERKKWFDGIVLQILSERKAAEVAAEEAAAAAAAKPAKKRGGKAKGGGKRKQAAEDYIPAVDSSDEEGAHAGGSPAPAPKPKPAAKTKAGRQSKAPTRLESDASVPQSAPRPKRPKAAAAASPAGSSPAAPSPAAAVDSSDEEIYPTAAPKAKAKAKAKAAPASPKTNETEAQRLREYIEGCGGDADLVSDWGVHTKQREIGATAGTSDTYFVSAEGRKFRSLPEVARHFGLDPKAAPKKKRAPGVSAAEKAAAAAAEAAALAAAEAEEEEAPADGEFKVGAIVDIKGRGKTKKYLVKWVGYDDDWNTWEEEETVAGTRALLRFNAEKKAEAALKRLETKRLKQIEANGGVDPAAAASPSAAPAPRRRRAPSRPTRTCS